MRLKDKNAVVTAAGSGIGRAIAIGFAKEGARVICGDINAETVKQTAETIQADGGEAIAVVVDVASKAQVDALFEKAFAAYQRIHVLVSAPGISTTRNFLDLPEDEWDRVMDVSLKGMYLAGQAAARHMAEHGGGSIIHISSICDEVAQANYPHYVAAKGGVKMLTKAMALDLVGHNIRVNALAPGAVETGTGFWYKDEFAGLREKVRARIPMGRPAQPEDMVGAAVFLASNEESSYVTGISLAVDGGYLAY
jgi:NAD(P)-dependent dehydrogenase (short-subunit alcohol dehydrogenase family)